jgi:enoyl-[acyl-carrier protein] reductase II
MSSVKTLLGIKYPVIQAGMVWVSGAKLAAAASEAGCLGLIGAGSMKPELLRQHILKAQSLTQKPFGVNVPLLYERIEEQLDLALELGVRIFFTSAGSPKKFTPKLKSAGAIVVHVTSTPELALKCQTAGVDAVVVEGFEAGGHNGRDEITSMVLIPETKRLLKIPVIAAGGIASGASIAAALALGADGVQIGSRFACTKESSAHAAFKGAIVESKSTSTMLSMKNLVPVRLLKNDFFQQVSALESQGAGPAQLMELLGKGRAKKGMLEGDLEQGELEIGQVAGLIEDIPTVASLVKRLLSEYEEALIKLPANLG